MTVSGIISGTYVPRVSTRHTPEPDDPPRQWTHPCNCTLIAHETCLLQWIKASQQNLDRAANAMKCPQCGERYVLESKNPLTLRFLNAWNRALSRVGKWVTVSCVTIVAISFGAGASSTVISDTPTILTTPRDIRDLHDVRCICREGVLGQGDVLHDINRRPE